MWGNASNGGKDDSRWQLSCLGFERLRHEARSHVPVYFHDSIVAAVRSAQPLAHERGVAFEATLAQSSNSDAAVEVLGDPVLLQVMVENAVGNALRSSPAGSCVELDVQVLDESLVLYVRDHGPGPGVAGLTGFGSFEASLQAIRSSRSSLDLARRVAEHHRGTTSFRNVADGGCEFRIRLPRWRSEVPSPLRFA